MKVLVKPGVCDRILCPAEVENPQKSPGGIRFRTSIDHHRGPTMSSLRIVRDIYLLSGAEISLD